MAMKGMYLDPKYAFLVPDSVNMLIANLWTQPKDMEEYNELMQPVIARADQEIVELLHQGRIAESLMAADSIKSAYFHSDMYRRQVEKAIHSHAPEALASTQYHGWTGYNTLLGFNHGGRAWLLIHYHIIKGQLLLFMLGLKDGRPYVCALSNPENWYEEYLDLTLAVRVVRDMDEAMDHIARYGSLHTEAIVTQNYDNARRFLAEVDSSVVLLNASTRFNDGGQLGLGAEIGISTCKLHSFGPMGLEELTTTKFIVYGEGQIRQ